MGHTVRPKYKTQTFSENVEDGEKIIFLVKGGRWTFFYRFLIDLRNLSPKWPKILFNLKIVEIFEKYRKSILIFRNCQPLLTTKEMNDFSF